MKLLIILLAMLATAGGAYHSWIEREQYVQAALLSEGFALTSSMKLRAADYYLTHGVMPNDNADVGLQAPKSIFGTSVKRIAINRGGVLTVDFEDKIGAKAMTFSPTVTAVNGGLGWSCTSDSIDRRVLEKLKPSCSYLPATPSSQLMNAIANKDLANVDSILSLGAKPDALVNGNTPLMLAAKIGELSVVQRLIAAGAQVDNSALNAERRTPLMVAVSSDHSEIVALLLSEGASINRKDYRGMTVMDYAVATDRRLGGERYVLMVAARSNPQFAGVGVVNSTAALQDEKQLDESLRNLYTEYVQAGKTCHIQRLSSLLNEQGELNSPEIVDGLPMGKHIRKPACSVALTEHIKQKASYRKALHAFFASQVQRCNVSQVRTALQLHPDMDVMRQYSGQGHLERAVRSGCYALVRMMVREKHLSTELPDDLIITAILQAPQESLLKLVGNLIEAGANVNGQNELGQSTLATAIALEQPVVAKYLVDAGANVNEETYNNSFPIIEATKKGYAHLVRQMIAGGADVNARDTMGRTALFAAVGQGRLRLVDSLLRSGAATRINDNSGIDPFVLAESQNLPSIQALLLANRNSQIASSD